MTLPLPKLDDKTFAQLVEDARKLIPRLAPEWTDHNIHDPGITFIDLFAWLTETQQYYLDQIRDQNRLKFLKLLGAKPQEAASAKVDVTFWLRNSGYLFSVGLAFVDELNRREVSEALREEFRSHGWALTPPIRVEVEQAGSTWRIFDANTNYYVRSEGRTLNVYNSGKESVHVPKGTRLAAEDVIFETEEALLVLPVEGVKRPGPAKILTYSKTGLTDNTTQNLIDGLSFLAFGEEAEEGSRLYLGFKHAFPKEAIVLTFNLFEDYPVAVGSHDNEPPNVLPSAVVHWEYFSAAGWVPLTLYNDGTGMLSQSGKIVFQGPGEDMEVSPILEGLYYGMRCTVTQAGYEISPRIDSILLNTISAVQRSTLCEVISFSGEPPSYLALGGASFVQVREPDGCWKDLPDKGKIPSPGKEDIRLIACLPEFDQQRVLGRSNGLPNQVFRLDQARVIPESLILQVGETVKKKGEDDRCWRDWERVDDFDASTASDRHYVFNVETREIIFGDGLNGAIPPADEHEPNIRLIACQVSGGTNGNVNAGAITKLVAPAVGLEALEKVENQQQASGGADRETLEEAEVRARKELKLVTRAVTSDDFEFLARATPGLRVARAKALPLFEQGLTDYPETSALDPVVTVVVVPYSPSPKPIPSPNFLLTVCRHLDLHRLITTRLRVVPPDYVQVNVAATVLIKPGFDTDATRQAIIDALKRFLHPLEGGSDGKGWPFGRTVYRSEVTAVIEKVNGVDCVESVRLTAVGVGFTQYEDRNVLIQPYSLVYSGNHLVEVISPKAECRGGK